MAQATWPVVPFSFQLPDHISSSVAMQVSRGREKDGFHIGIDYELVVFIDVDRQQAHPKRHRTVVLNIRKLSDGPTDDHAAMLATPPVVLVSKKYLGVPFIAPAGEHPLKLSVFLDKPVYRLGDSVSVTVVVDNRSTRTVKGIQIAIRQHSQLRDAGGLPCVSVKATISRLNMQAGCMVKPDETLQQAYSLPVCEDSRMDQGRIALDGAVHDEDTDIAASARAERDDERTHEGIVVAYEVKVKLELARSTLSLFDSETSCRVPFLLYHTRQNPRKLSVDLPWTPSCTPVLALEVETPGMRSSSFASEHGKAGDQDTFNLIFEEFIRGRAERSSTHDAEPTHPSTCGGAAP